MGRYNLLDEPWISVFEDQTDEKKDVSMLEFFRNAASYRSLAGEMETQNFAVMRFLLSVVQTVFSRVNFDGQPLSGITLDEKGIQTEPVDSDDLDDEISETAAEAPAEAVEEVSETEEAEASSEEAVSEDEE